MLYEACSVVDPIQKKPLSIRAGIHSGPVVAGVVGAKMPRFFTISNENNEVFLKILKPRLFTIFNENNEVFKENSN